MTKRKSSDAGGKTEGKLNIEASDAQAFSGSASEAFQLELLRQVSRAVYLPEWKTNEQKREAVTAAVEAIKNIAPRSELEGMLASQMVSAHNAALECLRRAMHPNQNDQGIDLNLKHAAKLMALYERQLAALDKHRGKGRQKITVEHVTVEAGGQAIVGEVHADGKSSAKEPLKRAALPDDSAAEEVSRGRMKDVRPAGTPKKARK